MHARVPSTGVVHTLTWATYPLTEVTVMVTLGFSPRHPTIQVRVIPLLNSGSEAGQTRPVDFTPEAEGELEEEASR